MTMEQSELRVLANMVNYPERAFDLLGRLGIGAEDFSAGPRREAFAALVTKGVCPGEKLLAEVVRCLPGKKWTDKELDAFNALAPSLGEVDSELVGFAQGVARTKLQKVTLAIMSDADLPANMLTGELDRAKAEFKAGVEGDSSGRSREVALFREFLSVPNTFVHRPTELTAEYYAKIFCYLKKAGTPIPTNDIWIAAETMEIGGRLCSCDRHFANVPMLNWTFCGDL